MIHATYPNNPVPKVGDRVAAGEGKNRMTCKVTAVRTLKSGRFAGEQMCIVDWDHNGREGSFIVQETRGVEILK